MTFPNVLDTSESGNRVLEQYETLSGMTAVPLTYVIDRKGQVVEAWYGYEAGRAEKVTRKLGL